MAFHHRIGPPLGDEVHRTVRRQGMIGLVDEFHAVELLAKLPRGGPDQVGRADQDRRHHAAGLRQQGTAKRSGLLRRDDGGHDGRKCLRHLDDPFEMRVPLHDETGHLEHVEPELLHRRGHFGFALDEKPVVRRAPDFRRKAHDMLRQLLDDADAHDEFVARHRPVVKAEGLAPVQRPGPRQEVAKHSRDQGSDPERWGNDFGHAIAVAIVGAEVHRVVVAGRVREDEEIVFACDPLQSGLFADREFVVGAILDHHSAAIPGHGPTLGRRARIFQHIFGNTLKPPKASGTA